MVTTSRGILYPSTSDAITPLANHFANLATTTNTALDNIDNASGYLVGTDAQRLALTAPKLRNGIIWRSTDTNLTWFYDGTIWYGPNIVTSTKTSGSQNSSSGTPVAITGISVAVTASASSSLLITGGISTFSSVAGDIGVVNIVQNGTILRGFTFSANSGQGYTNTTMSTAFSTVLTGMTGAQTFTLSFARAAGTGTVTNSNVATAPTYLSVQVLP